MYIYIYLILLYKEEFQIKISNINWFGNCQTMLRYCTQSTKMDKYACIINVIWHAQLGSVPLGGLEVALVYVKCIIRGSNRSLA